MIGQLEPSQLGAPQKAALIYAQARAELSSRLWQAALGNDRSGADGETSNAANGPDLRLDALLSLLITDVERPVPQPAPSREAPPAPPIARDAVDSDTGGRSFRAMWDSEPIGLGVNARYQTTLSAAAERTGIPASALAAIVHAEAAKGQEGRWLPYSRNPRSSAAGLGQFLSGTWQSEAERSGSWLNAQARVCGWLDPRGKILPGARSPLLALRYDADMSIHAIADYAKANLDALRRSGAQVGDGVDGIARAAYLGHHLGIGDATRFLKGGLAPERARLLLNAQIGAADASQRIAAAGSASGAHRAWLLDYVGRNIRPSRFGGGVPLS